MQESAKNQGCIESGTPNIDWEELVGPILQTKTFPNL